MEGLEITRTDNLSVLAETQVRGVTFSDLKSSFHVEILPGFLRHNDGLLMQNSYAINTRGRNAPFHTALPTYHSAFTVSVESRHRDWEARLEPTFNLKYFLVKTSIYHSALSDVSRARLPSPSRTPSSPTSSPPTSPTPASSCSASSWPWESWATSWSSSWSSPPSPWDPPPTSSSSTSALQTCWSSLSAAPTPWLRCTWGG